MSTSFPFGKRTVAFPYSPDKLALETMCYIERAGKVRDHHITDTSHFLSMDYDAGELFVSFIAYVNDGQGSHFQLRAFYGQREVLQLSGGMGKDGPTNTKVDLFSPGAWQELTPFGYFRRGDNDG